MPSISSLTALPFKAAIAFFKKKVLLTSQEFYGLTDEARDMAFTVSRVTKMDIVKDIYDAVNDAIAKGETVSDFRKKLADTMVAKGWGGLSPWHADTVFRTNVQSAYSVGEYRQFTKHQERFPAWEYQATDDSRVRLAHLLQNGKIYPVDHPYWKTWYPPNGYNCRCDVRPVHKYEIEGRSLKVSNEDDTGTTKKVLNPVTGEEENVTLKPDPGFEHNPALHTWTPDLKKYPEKLVELFAKEKR